jgi:hypothetical protein
MMINPLVGGLETGHLDMPSSSELLPAEHIFLCLLEALYLEQE